MAPLDQNDDEPRTVAIRFATILTGGGRSVSVGYAENDDATYLRFINNQGTETKFGLTTESADALARLLAQGRSVFDRSPDQAVWTLVCKILDVAPDADAGGPDA